jgi:hypothetical protein
MTPSFNVRAYTLVRVVMSVKPPVHSPAPAQPSGKVTTLYVATPCFGCMVSNPYLVSLMQLQSECSRRSIACHVDMIGNESLVERARNILTARFLKSGASHLLFIDADIAFQPDTVFELLDVDKDIVTAVYPKKSFNWDAIKEKVEQARSLPPESREPLPGMGLDYNINIDGATAKVENGFIKVLDSATGFMMIKRDVLLRMNEKYADTLTCVNDLPGDRDDPMYCKEYVALFDCMIDKVTRRYLSEDYSFCRRAQDIGIEIWASVTRPLCHIGNHIFEGDLRQRFSMVYKQ